MCSSFTKHLPQIFINYDTPVDAAADAAAALACAGSLIAADDDASLAEEDEDDDDAGGKKASVCRNLKCSGALARASRRA